MISVKLVDRMGSDLLVANAARQSFGTSFDEWSDAARTPRGRSDRELVEDLGRDGHELPFRHPQIVLNCAAPLPIARQLGKHQVGLSWSEISRRYKVKDITFHRIGIEWRKAPEERRQGSGDLLSLSTQAKLDFIQRRNIANCERDYEEALALGASPEQARVLLPQAMDIRWTWTGSLLAFADIHKKRSHADTQAETRAFAELVQQSVQPLYPVAWAALRARR